MSDDPRDLPSELDRILRPEVTPMPTPAGRYDAIVAEANRRRRHAVLLSAVSAAAVLVIAVVGVVLVVRPDDDRGGRVAAPPSTTATPTPTPTGTPTATPSPSPSTDASAPTVPTPARPQLPTGGPVPARFSPVSVSTASAEVLYALGNPVCATPPCTSLARSLDRGRTWSGLPAPRAAYESGQEGVPYVDAVSQVRFANEDDGWVFGGALWATHDGVTSASSWHRIDLGGERVLDLATDGTTVWALTGRDCQDGGCTGATLRSAAVGEDDFTPVRGVGGTFDVMSGQLGVTGSTVTVLLRVRSLGADVATAAVWVRAAGSAFHRVDVTSVCADADSTRSGAVSLLQPAVKDGAIVATCSRGAGTGQSFSAVSTSSDLGVTWRRAAGTLQLTSNLTQTLAPASARLLAAASGGSDDLGGYVQVSRDGGASWQEAKVARPTAGWRYLGAAGGQRIIGLAYGEDSLWVSTDAGVTWESYPIH